MPLKLLLVGMAGAMVGSYRRPAAEQPSALVAANSDHMVLEPAPINPEWIIRGTPVARMSKHSASVDEAGLTALWDCTAGEFRWYFGWDETVYILEGEVHVTDADGGTLTLRIGDVAYFRAGTWATWKIDTYLRKVAFMRRALPAPASFIYRASDAARRRLGRRKRGALS